MNIKELREKFNLTQQELADNTGIPRDRIAKWEQLKGAPKAEDYKILDDYFRKLREELPRGTKEVPKTANKEKSIWDIKKRINLADVARRLGMVPTE